jgi:hypothetical protein
MAIPRRAPSCIWHVGLHLPRRARSKLALEQRKRTVQISARHNNRLRRCLLAAVPANDAAECNAPHALSSACVAGGTEVLNLDERPEVAVSALRDCLVEKCIHAMRVEEGVAVPTGGAARAGEEVLAERLAHWIGL